MGTITWGAWVGDLVRLGIQVDGSGTTRNIILLVGWNGGVSFSNTISRGGSWAGSKTCSLNKPWGSTGQASHYAVSQTWTGTRTYTASFPTPWGTASVSRSVTNTAPPAPSVPKPGAPSNFKITRTGDTTATLSFTKGSNATSTQITASKNGTSWYELTNPTGTSQAVVGLAVNSQWRFNLYSKNSTGTSAVIGPYYMYTKPATPSAPTLADGGKLTWTLPSLYKHGVELQRTDNAGASVSTVELGPVTVWTDPNAQTPSTQYRVRCWTGPSYDQAKTWSDWSEWSQPKYLASYAPPKITTLKAQRCNSAGQLTELGTYLRVTCAGTASSVKKPMGNLPEGKLTLKSNGALVVEEIAGVRPTNLQKTPLAYVEGKNDLRVLYDPIKSAVFAAGLDEEVESENPSQLVEINWLTRQVQWRKKGTTTWNTSTIATKGTPANWSHAVVVGAGKITPTDSWEVRYTVVDAYSPMVQAIVTLATSQVALSLAKTGVGVGKTWERGALDVAGDAHISGNINAGGDVRIEGSLTVGKPDVITITGSFSFTPPAAGSAVSGSQSFGQVFAGLPVVMLTPANGRIGVSVTARSAKAFSWDLRNDSGGPLPVGSGLCYWMAVGKPA